MFDTGQLDRVGPHLASKKTMKSTKPLRPTLKPSKQFMAPDKGLCHWAVAHNAGCFWCFCLFESLKLGHPFSSKNKASELIFFGTAYIKLVRPASYWSKRIYVMFQLREVRSHHSAILVVHLSIQSLHDIGQSCLQLWVQRDQEGVCNLTLADLPSKLISPNGHKARLRLAWNKYSSSNTCQLECRHKRPRALAKFRNSAPFFQCLFEQKEQKSIITLSNVKFSIEKNSASKHTTLEPHDKEAEKTWKYYMSCTKSVCHQIHELPLFPRQCWH